MSRSAIAQTATAVLSNLTILLASMLCLCKRLSVIGLLSVDSRADPRKGNGSGAIRTPVSRSSDNYLHPVLSRMVGLAISVGYWC